MKKSNPNEVVYELVPPAVSIEFSGPDGALVRVDQSNTPYATSDPVVIMELDSQTHAVRRATK